jgi:hypothetical protein
VHAGCRYAKWSAQQQVETQDPWADGSVMVDWFAPECYRRDRRRVVMDFGAAFDDGGWCDMRAVVWLTDRRNWRGHVYTLGCF